MATALVSLARTKGTTNKQTISPSLSAKKNPDESKKINDPVFTAPIVVHTHPSSPPSASNSFFHHHQSPSAPASTFPPNHPAHPNLIQLSHPSMTFLCATLKKQTNQSVSAEIPPRDGTGFEIRIPDLSMPSLLYYLYHFVITYYQIPCLLCRLNFSLPAERCQFIMDTCF